MNIDCKDGSFVKCTKYDIVPLVQADYECWTKNPNPRPSCASGGSGSYIADWIKPGKKPSVERIEDFLDDAILNGSAC